ncbi:hypothetical protein CkaCkLH20_13297 [Colletotrichum karsti]|uniref:CBM-cenC domain-containing protein n=1 Tax=Colletotrichum karsti TaxID=1095194 RepID=A0A9P6HVW3_9PEZI|nr:uncharacterized protein CkaCkLH20_13297 [Colletotrichum karsti]KAF9869226.1 hypothetical protein CkaCkLH20_13297 [Colletotrichum karsti]
MSSTLLRLLGLAGTAQAVCSNFVIDNFSRPAVGGNNKLKSWTSDDSSMADIAIKSGVLSFTPKTDSSSYYYETLGCVKAASKGYKALSLTMNGPKDASVMLEIQTKASCTDTNYQSQWVQITGLTGSAQNISIALSSFTTANLDAVSGFVWSTYSVFDKYQLSNLQFTCDDGLNPPASTALTTSQSDSTSSSVISASTIATLSSSTASSFATSLVAPYVYFLFTHKHKNKLKHLDLSDVDFIFVRLEIVFEINFPNVIFSSSIFGYFIVLYSYVVLGHVNLGYGCLDSFQVIYQQLNHLWYRHRSVVAILFDLQQPPD